VLCSTSAAQFAVVNSTTFAPAIVLSRKHAPRSGAANLQRIRPFNLPVGFTQTDRQFSHCTKDEARQVPGFAGRS